MRSRILFIGATVLLGLLPAGLQAGGTHRDDPFNVNITTDGDEPLTDCSGLRIRFDDRAAARAEATMTARITSGPLTIHLPASSGAYIRGADRTDTAMKVCKAALDSEDLAKITATIGADGHVAVSGPSGGGWIAYLLIETPRGTAVDAAASNGPISIHGISASVAARTESGPVDLADLTGTVRARAENGPISLRNCRASVDAEAVNGPISLHGGGGDQSLQTQNGPISVDLAGDHWDGARLEAHAGNGPLSVQIPENYRTGTRIESAGHSPFNCRVGACAHGRKSWDDDSKSVEFGSGATLVRLSTVNGPVSIHARGTDGDDE